MDVLHHFFLLSFALLLFCSGVGKTTYLLSFAPFSEITLGFDCARLIRACLEFSLLFCAGVKMCVCEGCCQFLLLSLLARVRTSTEDFFLTRCSSY